MPLFSNNSALKSNDLQQQQKPHLNVKLTATTTTVALPIIHEFTLEPEDDSDGYQRSFVAGLEAQQEEQLLSSSMVQHVASNSSLCSLTSNCSSSSNISNISSISNCSNTSTISKQPSNASKHFENTYKLLGKQLESNCQRTADRLQQLDPQLDSLDSLSSLSSCCASMSAIVNGTEPPPTRLELELEAVDRMRVIVQQMKATPQEATANGSAPLLALLHDFAAKGQPKRDSTAQEDSTPSTPVPSPIAGVLPVEGPNFELPAHLLQSANSWELMYYASKNVDGQNCLKVVRSLLTNKGKNHPLNH
ncbi:hypothetical protein AWZ03_009388 [Drosophila navojoa]|uniref:Uncharacterized protein n=1 Tax=Drosophila navojoa TaxID=7232 RepID=A0A484B6E6_DRONA|nr:hypothetical protein AWZ03_009388 [Drosophila navojoa]